MLGVYILPQLQGPCIQRLNASPCCFSCLVCLDQGAACHHPSCAFLQVELQRVLYPVFVHVYLQLVQYGASHTAADLLNKYR